MTRATPTEILQFWSAAGPEKWWKKDDAFDAEIRERFGETHAAATRGELDHWTDSADGTLALIIVLDQFSRNLFRNDPKAFAQDRACVKIVKNAMNAGLDRQVSDDLVAFFYLPLMHCETLEDQHLCLEQMKRLNIEGNIKAAREHLEIIDKFGRFPHRNTVLGRETSEEEQAFLDGGGFSG